MVLTVDEVKQHLRIEYDEEDELIEKLILQAQAAFEHLLYPHRDPAQMF